VATQPERTVKPWSHWLMLAITAGLVIAVLAFVDLTPQVDQQFFFSSDDPQIQESTAIDRRFPSGSQLILSVAAPDISSDAYIERLGRLTARIAAMPSVTGVRSLADGPKDFDDAEKSPFWSRLLIADNHRSSNIIVLTPGSNPGPLIRRIEAAVDQFDRSDFHIRIAGAPYVVEMIRRSIGHDARYFGLTAIALFGVTMWWVFRSVRLTIGMLATCTTAVFATLVVQALAGKKVGVLTANLGIIVFVIALSHLVYMTFNWQTLSRREPHNRGALGAAARRLTFPPSFWSMVCASLGFGSLLFVQAKPLRELGFGGVIGSALALLCSYAMYPTFLAWAIPRRSTVTESGPTRPFWSRRFVPLSIGVIVVSAALGVGLTRLDTDPSLLEYFKRHSELRDGLEYIDRNGGSNPLTLVVAAADGRPLNHKDPYKELWVLQEALEQQKGVGTVVSLPLLIAEGRRRPLSFLVSTEHLLKALDEPKYGGVARTFITPDRSETAFYLRMVEGDRAKPRAAVVNDLRSIVRRNGFKLVLAGGIYRLQGELASLVASSLASGLFWLMVLFTVIAFIVARSIRGAAAMIVSLSLVPLCMLGGVGLLRVPIDIISSPATNICIGMAIDSMVHLMFGVRRAQHAGTTGWNAWIAGREEQWRGIVYSDVIIAAGFAIFVISDFPPTQRLGLVVVAGTLVDILGNLFVLPLLAGATLSAAGNRVR
jgi:predicted RND superfamily exporter protein